MIFNGRHLTCMEAAALAHIKRGSTYHNYAREHTTPISGRRYYFLQEEYDKCGLITKEKTYG